MAMAHSVKNVPAWIPWIRWRVALVAFSALLLCTRRMDMVSLADQINEMRKYNFSCGLTGSNQSVSFVK